MNDKDLEIKFQEYQNTSGDSTERLKQIGFIVGDLKQDPIITIQDFKAVITRQDCVSKEKISNQLKMVYKSHMTAEDISSLLKMGSDAFSIGEVADANRILPVNEDGGILISDFVNFLYL